MYVCSDCAAALAAAWIDIHAETDIDVDIDLLSGLRLNFKLVVLMDKNQPLQTRTGFVYISLNL